MDDKLILLLYFILGKLNKLSLSSHSLIIYKKKLSGISILPPTFKPTYTDHKIKKKQYIFAKYFFLLSYYIKSYGLNKVVLTDLTYQTYLLNWGIILGHE